LNPAVATSRNNAKTREAARRSFLLLDDRNANNNLGFAAITEPMPMITYAENQLTLAESATRTQGLSAGLTFLNAYRVQLNGGKLFRKLNAADELKYDPLLAADFEAGGIENADKIDPARALLREVIEERYIAFFNTWMTFNDLRRLRKSESDISVKIPFNRTTATKHPERIIYPQNELNANSNAVEPAEGLYFVLEVNK
jgi:hypothetical protein